MQNEIFNTIYKVIVNNEKIQLDKKSLPDYLELASRNKVLLHFLRSSGVYGDYRSMEEKRYMRFLKNLRQVAYILNDIEYVFIKLIKPVVYVPADIDLLVKREEVLKAVLSLMDNGFSIEIIEPYSITMINKDTVVDIYVHPTLGGMIYLDGDGLMKYKEFVEFNNINIPVLKKYAEALMTIVHAIYKERIFTLNDYITIRRWASQDTLTLAKELNSYDALVRAIEILKSVEKKQLNLPYKIPFSQWFKLLGKKIKQDKLTKCTTLNILKTVKDRRFGRLVILKLFKETY